MGIRAGVRAVFVNAPDSARLAIQAPALDVATQLSGDFDYIHLFVTTPADLDEAFPRLKAHLGPSGMLWVSWPKGRKAGADLTLPTVIRIGYDHGLVESTCLSIDATWSGLKFTHPKKGKTYHNSFGRLPEWVAEPTRGGKPHAT